MAKGIVSFKEQVINSKTNVIKDVNKKIEVLLNLLEKFDPYETFSHLNSFFKLSLIDIKSEHDLENYQMEMKYTVELVQMLMGCIPIQNFQNNEMKEDDINRIIEICSKIHSLKTQYIFALTYEMVDDDSDKAEYIFESEINSEITGKRYCIFEVEHYVELFTPLKSYFESLYGFSLNSLFNGIDKLKRKFMFGISDTQKEIREIMDKGLLESLDEAENRRLDELLNELFGLELQNVGDITGWPTDFLDIFSYEIGSNHISISNIDIDDIYTLHNEINRKPLIKIDGDYYYLSIPRLLDNLDRIVLKDMYSKCKNESENITKMVSTTCENLVGKYVKNIIPNVEILISNFYKVDSKVCENDVLLLFNKYLFIIEVKSGSFTPDVAMNNLNSHIQSLKKLIKDADSQASRFMEELYTKKSIVIYDSNKKKANVKKVINIDDYEEIFKIAITLECFNEIEAKADKVGLLNLNDGVIVCSLDDLRVYSDYFENNPVQFLHYLTYRRMATNSKGIELNDELNHLSLYIDYNCYPETAKNLVNKYKDVKNIIWEDVRRNIDQYYNGMYIGGDYIVEKPIQMLPKRIEELINYANKDVSFKNMVAICNVLDLSNNEKEKVSENIEMAINHYINTKRAKYIMFKVKNNKLLFFVCMVNDERYELSRIYDDMYANMKITNSVEANILFLYYSLDKVLNNINSVQLSKDDARYTSIEIDHIADEIRKRRVNTKTILGSKNKIGRNEMCPCGSGVKYKKCCGR